MTILLPSIVTYQSIPPATTIEVEDSAFCEKLIQEVTINSKDDVDIDFHIEIWCSPYWNHSLSNLTILFPGNIKEFRLNWCSLEKLNYSVEYSQVSIAFDSPIGEGGFSLSFSVKIDPIDSLFYSIGGEITSFHYLTQVWRRGKNLEKGLWFTNTSEVWISVAPPHRREIVAYEKEHLSGLRPKEDPQGKARKYAYFRYNPVEEQKGANPVSLYLFIDYRLSPPSPILQWVDLIIGLLGLVLGIPLGEFLRPIQRSIRPLYQRLRQELRG
jgi:hypothetical protein